MSKVCIEIQFPEIEDQMQFHTSNMANKQMS